MVEIVNRLEKIKKFDEIVSEEFESLIQKYGEQRSANCVQTIERFNQGEINVFAMTEQIRLELGKISGEIPVTTYSA